MVFEIQPRGNVVSICNVQSLCFYWVQQPKPIEELVWIEQLQEICMKQFKSLSKYHSDFKEDEYVAVYIQDRNQWNRGLVKRCFETHSDVLCTVFLIDQGQTIDIPTRKLLPLDKKFLCQPSLCYEIGIYGIFPKCKKDGHVCDKICECPVTEFVKRLLKDNITYFEHITDINGISFGCITFELSKSCIINLAEYLCKEGVAEKSKDFEADVRKHHSHLSRNENQESLLTKDAESKPIVSQILCDESQSSSCGRKLEEDVSEKKNIAGIKREYGFKIESPNLFFPAGLNYTFHKNILKLISREKEKIISEFKENSNSSKNDPKQLTSSNLQTNNLLFDNIFEHDTVNCLVNKSEDHSLEENVETMPNSLNNSLKFTGSKSSVSSLLDKFKEFKINNEKSRSGNIKSEIEENGANKVVEDKTSNSADTSQMNSSKPKHSSLENSVHELNTENEKSDVNSSKFQIINSAISTEVDGKNTPKLEKIIETESSSSYNTSTCTGSKNSMYSLLDKLKSFEKHLKIEDKKSEPEIIKSSMEKNTADIKEIKDKTFSASTSQTNSSKLKHSSLKSSVHKLNDEKEKSYVNSSKCHIINTPESKGIIETESSNSHSSSTFTGSKNNIYSLLEKLKNLENHLKIDDKRSELENIESGTEKNTVDIEENKDEKFTADTFQTNSSKLKHSTLENSTSNSVHILKTENEHSDLNNSKCQINNFAISTEIERKNTPEFKEVIETESSSLHSSSTYTGSKNSIYSLLDKLKNFEKHLKIDDKKSVPANSKSGIEMNTADSEEIKDTKYLADTLQTNSVHKLKTENKQSDLNPSKCQIINSAISIELEGKNTSELKEIIETSSVYCSSTCTSSKNSLSSLLDKMKNFEKHLKIDDKKSEPEIIKSGMDKNIADKEEIKDKTFSADPLQTKNSIPKHASLENSASNSVHTLKTENKQSDVNSSKSQIINSAISTELEGKTIPELKEIIETESSSSYSSSTSTVSKNSPSSLLDKMREFTRIKEANKNIEFDVKQNREISNYTDNGYKTDDSSSLLDGLNYPSDFPEDDIFSGCLMTDSQISLKSIKSTDSWNTNLHLMKYSENQNRLAVKGCFDLMQYDPVLVHGNKSYSPIKKLYGAPKIDSQIYKKSENCGLRDLTKIQKYAYPIIIDQRNVVLVGPQQSGKTLAYILPLLCLMKQKENYNQLPDGGGPYAIIIVNGWKKVEEIYKMCIQLLQSVPELNVQMVFRGGNEIDKLINLANGCDLLISTPRYILNLLEYKYVLKLDRLCHVVLGNFDLLLKSFLPELQELLKLVKKEISFRIQKVMDAPVQIIVVSQNWSPSLEELALNILKDPIICISSFLEAAVYAKLQSKLVLLKPENKIPKLIDLLEKRPKNRKSVVICVTPEEVNSITLAAKTKNIEVLSIHHELSHIYSTDLQNVWALKNPYDEPILVCTDEVLEELGVLDARNLIHFSLPISKSLFSFRFRCLFHAFRNILNPNDKKSCDVYILTDETNEIQLPEITQFLHRTGIKVPPSLDDTVASILKQQEENKVGVSFCDNLKQFGQCWEQTKCQMRHILKKDEDTSKNVPQSGTIKMAITHIHNACHYSVRLLEHHNGTAWVQHAQNYLQIYKDVNDFCQIKESRKLHGYPKVGDIAAVKNKIFNKTYERVKVLQILKYDSKNNPYKVSVKMLDRGEVVECQSLELYNLPEKLKVYPAQSIDVYICNLLPTDLDTSWNSSIEKIVWSWVEKLSKENLDSSFMGKIVLSLCDELWLDPFTCSEWLSYCKTTFEHMSFRDNLLKGNLAVDNPKHLSNLYKLCEDADISYLPITLETQTNLPSSGISNLKKKNKIKPQWANLDRDLYILVHLICPQSFNVLFLRHTAFQDRLNILEKDIQLYLKNKHSESMISHGSLEPGDICLTKDPVQDKWVRGMVKQNENENLEVLLVDYGEIIDVCWDDVKMICPEFITRLPFQIIECCLAGVECESKEQQEEAIDFLSNCTQKDGDCVDIVVKVCDLELKANTTGGRKYKVLLITKEGVVLNEELVAEQNIGTWRTEEKHYIDNLEFNEELVAEENIGTLQTEEKHCSDSLYQNQIINMESMTYLLKNLENGAFDIEMNGDLSSSVLLSNEVNTSTTKKVSSQKQSGEVKKNETSVKLAKQDLKETTAHKNVHLSDFLSYGTCPNLVWKQTEQSVCIQVMLNEVKEYRLIVKVRSLYFSTIHNDKLYGLNLDLYGGCEPDGVSHSAKGFYVEIKLKKLLKGFSWPRLIHDSKKFAFIKTSLEHYEETEPFIDGFTTWTDLKTFKLDQIAKEDSASSISAKSDIYESDQNIIDLSDPFY